MRSKERKQKSNGKKLDATKQGIIVQSARKEVDDRLTEHRIRKRRRRCGTVNYIMTRTMPTKGE